MVIPVILQLLSVSLFAGIDHLDSNGFDIIAEIFDNGTVKSHLFENQHFEFCLEI
jgi:hypothetical protein